MHQASGSQTIGLLTAAAVDAVVVKLCKQHLLALAALVAFEAHAVASRAIDVAAKACPLQVTLCRALLNGQDVPFGRPSIVLQSPLPCHWLLALLFEEPAKQQWVAGM